MFKININFDFANSEKQKQRGFGVYVLLCVKVYEMNGSETKAKLTVKSFVVFDLTSNRYRMIHKRLHLIFNTNKIVDEARQMGTERDKS